MSEQNQQAPSQPLALAPQRRPVEDEIALFDTAKFEQMQRISRGMSLASLIPKHLKGVTEEEGVANCLMVVNQAQRWGIDPYSCASETYVIGGKLGYQGKLIAAIINSRSNIASGLRHVFNSKQGDDLAVVIYGSVAAGIPDGAKALLKTLAETGDRSTLGDLEDMGILAVRLTVKQAKTQNDMWTRDPEQKLVYSGSIRWARRYRPEIILGVKIEDDIERETELPKALAGSVVTSEPAPVKTITAQTETLPPEPKKPVAKAKPVKLEEKAAEPVKEPEPTKSEEPAPKPEPDPLGAAEPEPEPTPAPATTKGKLPAVTEEEPAAPSDYEDAASPASLLQRVTDAGFQGRHLVSMAVRMNLCPTTAKTIAEIPANRRQDILDDWDTALDAMKSLAGKEGK